jgi:small GTP-binding protein
VFGKRLANVFKIVFLGDSDVGKTTLLQCHTNASLDSNQARQIGSVLYGKNVIYEELKYKLVIWNILGEETFSKIREQYYTLAEGAFFVFDTTNPSSLESIDEWLNSLYSSTGKVPVVIVENKIELESKIPRSAVESVIKKYGVKYIRTISKRKNTNLEEAFTWMISQIIEYYQKAKPL